MIRPSAQTELSQVVAYRRIADAESASNLGLLPACPGKPCNKQPSSVAHFRSCGSVAFVDVLGVGSVELKVLEPIVRAVSVDVVDTLRRCEPSPQALLHDPAMLHDASASVRVPSPSSDVALGCDATAVESDEARPGQGIEMSQSAGIGAEPLFSAPKNHAAAAHLTYSGGLDRRSVAPTTGAATGAVAMGDVVRNDKRGATFDTRSLDPLDGAAAQRGRGTVHDLHIRSIPHSLTRFTLPGLIEYVARMEARAA